MVTRIGGDQRRRRAQRRERRDHRQQTFLFRARAERLGLHDDLVRRVNGRHAGKALEDALPGRHLRALVVREVALPYAARGTLPIGGMRGEPLTQLLRVRFKRGDALRLLRALIWFAHCATVYTRVYFHGAL